MDKIQENLNVIEFITMATLGNTQDFGDLSAQEQYSSNQMRAIFGGGELILQQ